MGIIKYKKRCLKDTFFMLSWFKEKIITSHRYLFQENNHFQLNVMDEVIKDNS